MTAADRKTLSIQSEPLTPDEGILWELFVVSPQFLLRLYRYTSRAVGIVLLVLAAGTVLYTETFD